jgi:hypothetical protein
MYKDRVNGARGFILNCIIGGDRSGLSDNQCTALEAYKKRLYEHLVKEGHHTLPENKDDVEDIKDGGPIHGVKLSFAGYLTALANCNPVWNCGSSEKIIGIKWPENVDASLLAAFGEVFDSHAANVGGWVNGKAVSGIVGSLFFGDNAGPDVGSVYVK